MPNMFRIKIVVQELFDDNFKDMFLQLKNVYGKDKLIKTLALLNNRIIDDIEELKKEV